MKYVMRSLCLYVCPEKCGGDLAVIRKFVLCNDYLSAFTIRNTSTGSPLLGGTGQIPGA